MYKVQHSTEVALISKTRSLYNIKVLWKFLFRVVLHFLAIFNFKVIF